MDARRANPKPQRDYGFGRPTGGRHDDQASSIAPDNDEKHTEDLLQHIVVMAAENLLEVGN